MCGFTYYKSTLIIFVDSISEHKNLWDCKFGYVFLLVKGELKWLCNIQMHELSGVFASLYEYLKCNICYKHPNCIFKSAALWKFNINIFISLHIIKSCWHIIKCETIFRMKQEIPCSDVHFSDQAHVLWWRFYCNFKWYWLKKFLRYIIYFSKQYTLCTYSVAETLLYTLQVWTWCSQDILH